MHILIDKNFNPFFTGIAYDIIAPSNNSRTFFQSQFEYYLQKGDSVGIYVSGSAPFSGGVSVYATLGYRIIPPSLLASSAEMSRHKSLRQSPHSSIYNRFPFNNLMNFRRQAPISFEDQLEIIRSASKNPENIYGRMLTPHDYELRSMIPRDGPTIYQDAIAFLFNNLKSNGSFVDFSERHQNTKELEQQYRWKGLLFGFEDDKTEQNERLLSATISNNFTQINYQDVFTKYNMPEQIDYFSLDLRDTEVARHAFETFSPVLDKYKFNFLTIRHDGDPNLQSRTGNIMHAYHYIRLFYNIIVEKENKFCSSEDWYVHPELITSFPFIQKIPDNPDNADNLLSSKCIHIILAAYNNDL